MIVSHTHRFIFISNGKTGTRSVEKALIEYQEESGFDEGSEGLWVGGHLPAEVARERLGREVWDAYYKFTIVRNPWDWVVSQYFYNMVPKRAFIPSRNPLFTAHHLARTLRRRKPLPWQRLSERDVLHLYDLLKNYRAVEWADTLFQSNYTHDRHGNLLLDFVGKFRNLRADFDAAMRAAGLEGRVHIPHINATKHRPYASYYSNRTVGLVGELWREDIERFGYEFA